MNTPRRSREEGLFLSLGAVLARSAGRRAAGAPEVAVPTVTGQRRPSPAWQTRSSARGLAFALLQCTQTICISNSPSCLPKAARGPRCPRGEAPSPTRSRQLSEGAGASGAGLAALLPGICSILRGRAIICVIWSLITVCHQPKLLLSLSQREFIKRSNETGEFCLPKEAQPNPEPLRSSCCWEPLWPWCSVSRG